MSTRFHTEGAILMDIHLDGKTVYLSDRSITVTYEHEPLVVDWGGIDMASGSNGISETSDCTVTLFNRRTAFYPTEVRLSEIFDNYTLEGRKVVFRQYFPGTTYANCDIIYTGRIDSISFNDMYFYIGIKDDEEVFKEVPVGRIAKADYANCPDDAVGLAKPIVYGKSATLSHITFQPKNVWPTVCTDQYNNAYMIADHDIKQTALPDVIGTYGLLYIYVEELGGYLYCNNYTNSSYAHAATGTIITLNQDTGWTWVGRPKLKGASYDMAATDWSNAVDEDQSSTLVLEDGKKFYLTMGQLPNLGPIKPKVGYVYVKITAATGTSPYGLLTYYNPDYDDGNGGTATGVDIDAAAVAAGFKQFQFNADVSAHGEEKDQADAYNIWNWDEIGKYEFGIEVGAGDTITISDFYIYVTDLNFTPNARIRKLSKQTEGQRRDFGRRG